MTISVRALDELPAAAAAEHFAACCGASRWVAEMVARRPFHTLVDLLGEADDVWAALGPDDWHEAFAHHPRIGERATGAAASEQARVHDADRDVRDALAEANRAYEARFGQIYLVCASGRSAEELLAIARARMSNDPETELRVAAEEQRKITRLRLEKLLVEDDA